MGSPVFINELTSAGSLSAGSAVAIFQDGDTKQTTVAAFTDVVVKAAGTLAAGSVQVMDWRANFTGHSGGTTDVAGLKLVHTSNGANAVSQSISGRFVGQSTGTGAVTTLRGVLGEVRVDGSGDVDTGICLSAQFSLTSTGNILTNVQNIRVAAPDITGSGTIPNMEGVRVSNIGHANITTDVFAFRAADQSGNAGSKFGFYGELTSGSGKWNFYAAGNANNYFNGRVLMGQTTDDGSTALQITGTGTAIKINGTNNTYIEINDGTRQIAVGRLGTEGVVGTLTNHDMSVSANNSYVARFKSGGDVQFAQALVALGGGAAPTLGTIGGSGPAAAAQNSWKKFVDSTGASFWVPVWK